MNNFIEYFYNIKVEKIVYDEKSYSFTYDKHLYKLYVYEDDNNINLLYNINRIMIQRTLTSEIIINRNNEIISVFNNIKYILIKIYANVKKSITLEEISFLSNTLFIEKLNINWGVLWEKKIDYLEELINENGKKYPLIVDSFNYFVGLAENAISYYNNISFKDNYKFSISHKKIRLNDTVENLYNPLNIIFDYKIRDVAEYIKLSFFKKNNNILKEIDFYLKNNFLSIVEVKLLISRLLYPSFYFDMYEDIMIDEKEEKIIVNILKQLDLYEDYLSKIIEFFAQRFEIDEISWLKKEHN